MSRLRDKQIYYYIKKYKPKKILEIGTWNGSNAIKMINTCIEYTNQVLYTGIDLFELLIEKDIKKELAYKKVFSIKDVSTKLKKYYQSNRKIFIDLRQGYSRDILPKIYIKYDFIYIDGGHSVETIQNDWNFCKNMLESNGYVIFDDYFNIDTVGCKQIINNINQTEFKVKLLPIIDLYEDHEITQSQMVLVERK